MSIWATVDPMPDPAFNQKNDARDEFVNSDARTQNHLAMRLPNETMLDKYNRIAAFLRKNNDEPRLAIETPRVECSVAATDYLLFLQFAEHLGWLEEAARYSYRKNQTIALRRFYKNVEAETGYPRAQVESLKYKLDDDSYAYFGRLVAQLMRTPKYTFEGDYPASKPYRGPGRAENVVSLVVPPDRSKIAQRTREETRRLSAARKRRNRLQMEMNFTYSDD